MILDTWHLPRKMSQSAIASWFLLLIKRLRLARDRCERCVCAFIVDHTDISFKTLFHLRCRILSILTDAARLHAFLQKIRKLQHKSRRRKVVIASLREPKCIQNPDDSSYKFSMLRAYSLHEMYPTSLNIFHDLKKSLCYDRKPGSLCAGFSAA